MTSPDEQADSRARKAAIEMVEDALRSGRIVQADRDMRVDQLEQARTMQDVDLQVRDLRPAAPVAPPVSVPSSAPPSSAPASAPASVPAPSALPPSAPAGQPWPLVNYGPAHGDPVAVAAVVSRTTRAVGGVVAVVVLLAVVVPMVGAIIAFATSRSTFPDFGDLGPTDDTTYLPGQPPGENGVNVQTVDGFHEMVDALRGETGGVFVYDAVVYPRYAVLEVPTGKGTRYVNYYWDGETMERQDAKGLSSDDQFDLSLIEPQLVIDSLEEVRAKIEDPETWYAILTDPAGSQTQLSVHAANDFGESAYTVKTLDGTVVYEQQSPQG